MHQCNKTHKVTWKSAGIWYGAHAVVCACVIKVWLTLTDENASASNIASLLWSKWRNYAHGVNWNGCKDVNPGRTLAFVSIEMMSVHWRLAYWRWPGLLVFVSTTPCIINSKCLCACLVCKKVIKPKPHLPDCLLWSCNGYMCIAESRQLECQSQQHDYK